MALVNVHRSQSVISTNWTPVLVNLSEGKQLMDRGGGGGGGGCSVGWWHLSVSE